MLLPTAVIALLIVAWILVTPLGASPDEPAHIIKAAATVRGEWIGQPAGRPQDRIFTVPAYIADLGNVGCYAFHPQVPATCAFFTSDTEATRALSTAGLYNPTYYLLVGWVSLLPGNLGLVSGMRLMSGLLVLAFLAATLHVLRTTRRGVLLFLLITPTALFLTASVNPNALEWAAAAATTAAFHALANRGSEPPPRLLLVIANVSGCVLMMSRQLAPLWLVLIVATATLMPLHADTVRPLFQRMGFLFRRCWPVGAAAVLGTAYTLSSGSLAVGSHGTLPAGTAAALRGALDMTPTYWSQMIARFGWLDTTPPGHLPVVYATVAVAAMAFLLWRRPALDATLTVLLGGSLFAIPVLLEGISAPHSGYVWQGRYSLAIWAIFLVAATVSCASERSQPAHHRRSFPSWLRRPGLPLCGIVVTTTVSVAACAFRYGLSSYSAANLIAITAIIIVAGALSVAAVTRSAVPQ